MSERLTLEQLRAFIDTARDRSILPDDKACYWIRIQPGRAREAFAAGLAPFCALERSVKVNSNVTYTLPRGTVFVPLVR